MAALYALIALGGIVAGFITTLAGLGSVITLYILIEIAGLDPDIANGTNRIGIMAMSLMALPTFYRGGHLNIKRSWAILVVLFVGALMGVLLVMHLDNGAFRNIFRYLLIILLVVVLINPRRWIQASDDQAPPSPWLWPFFLLIGIYAGFIQVGTSMLLVVFLGMVCNYSLVDANGVKLSAMALYTSVCIAVFAIYDKVDWQAGIVLAIGEAIGAYLAARMSVGYPKANVVVRYVLISVLCLAIVQMFEVHRCMALMPNGLIATPKRSHSFHVHPHNPKKPDKKGGWPK